MSKEENTSSLVRIASSVSWQSRYYNDGGFDDLRLKDFYSEWVSKSIKGNLDDYVFHSKQGEIVTGFITIRFNSINSASIGLIAVDKSFSGKGIGKELIAYGCNFAFENLNVAFVEVVTQEKNDYALKAYDKIGFKVSDESLWFHKWVNK